MRKKKTSQAGNEILDAKKSYTYANVRYNTSSEKHFTLRIIGKLLI